MLRWLGGPVPVASFKASEGLGSGSHLGVMNGCAEQGRVSLPSHVLFCKAATLLETLGQGGCIGWGTQLFWSSDKAHQWYWEVTRLGGGCRSIAISEDTDRELAAQDWLGSSTQPARRCRKECPIPTLHTLHTS
jgi:hypothetical protein